MANASFKERQRVTGIPNQHAQSILWCMNIQAPYKKYNLECQNFDLRRHMGGDYWEMK